MTEKSGVSPLRRAAGMLAMILGGALAYMAATSPIAWGMVLGSGVELGGATGGRWLMNITEGLVALGVIVGGRLVDRGKLLQVISLGVVALGVGAVIGWRGHDSAAAVLIGLGGIASFGGGMLMAATVVIIATRARDMPGLILGAALCLGIAAVELVWASFSMMALSQGAAWVIRQIAWIGPLSGAVGGGLMLWADRFVPDDEGKRPGRLPFFGPPAITTSVKGTEIGVFWVILALALFTSFVGIMAQRAGSALSLIGLPENSFASGVLVGYTFAVARAAGALTGGLVHDLFGSRVAIALTALGLAITQIVLSQFTGYENPWHPLIGSIGVASGFGLTIVPMAAVFLLGRAHLGFHFGFLYLAVAFGNVMVLPLRPTVEANPQVALWITAGLCVAVAVAGARAQPAKEVPKQESGD